MVFADLGINGDMGYVTIVGDYLYATSLASDRIYRVDQNGNCEIIAGGLANGTDDGPGLEARFRIPNGICSNEAGDTLLVGDFDRIRVITGFDTATNGVSNTLEDQEMDLYPNPCSDTMTLSNVSMKTPLMYWEIRDQQGKLIQQGTRKENGSTFQLDVSALEVGVYMFILTSEDGKTLGKRFAKI